MKSFHFLLGARSIWTVLLLLFSQHLSKNEEISHLLCFNTERIFQNKCFVWANSCFTTCSTTCSVFFASRTISTPWLVCTFCNVSSYCYLTWTSGNDFWSNPSCCKCICWPNSTIKTTYPGYICRWNSSCRFLLQQYLRLFSKLLEVYLGSEY